MKEIKSREGYYLTQSTDVAENERVYVTAIKGANVNEADWREATEDEIAAWEEYKKKQEETLPNL